MIRECAGELDPAGDVELAEDLVQVVLDGAGADEQLAGDLPVGQALGGQPGDLRLLRREHLLGPEAARAGPLAGSAQLGPGPARESRHAHLVKHLEGAAELVAGIAAAALAAEPLPVHLVSPGQLRGEPAALQVLDGQPVLAMSVAGMLAMKEQFPQLRNGRPWREKDIADIAILRRLGGEKADGQTGTP